MFSNFNELFVMLSNQWKTVDEIENIQNLKLANLIKHSYATVPYYRRIFDENNLKPQDINSVKDLRKLPITSSSIYRKIPIVELISQKINIEKCIPVFTHGTTGIPLKVFFTRQDYTKLNLNWVRPLLANNVKLNYKRAIFARPQLLPKQKQWYEYFGIWRNIGISIFDEPEKWVNKLLQYKPQVIYGYSRTIRELAEYINKNKISGIKPYHIFSVTEMLEENTRAIINNIFGIEIVDLYGTAETGCIAWECPQCKNYHINADTVIVEFLKDERIYKENNACRIVVTNLQSYAMPLIRYELSDIGIPIYGKNVCKRGLPSMKILLGRLDDFIKLPSGKLLSPFFFFSVFSAENIGYNDIFQWEVIQDLKGDLNIYFVPLKKKIDSILLQKIYNLIIEGLGEKMEIRINIVEEIPNNKEKKFSKISSNIPK